MYMFEIVAGGRRQGTSYIRCLECGALFFRNQNNADNSNGNVSRWNKWNKAEKNIHENEMCSKNLTNVSIKLGELIFISDDGFSTMWIDSQIKINEAIKHFVQKWKEHPRQSKFWNERFENWFAAGVRHCQNVKWSSFVTIYYTEVKKNTFTLHAYAYGTPTGSRHDTQFHFR